MPSPCLDSLIFNSQDKQETIEYWLFCLQVPFSPKLKKIKNYAILQFMW